VWIHQGPPPPAHPPFPPRPLPTARPREVGGPWPPRKCHGNRSPGRPGNVRADSRFPHAHLFPSVRIPVLPAPAVPPFPIFVFFPKSPKPDAPMFSCSHSVGEVNRAEVIGPGACGGPTAGFPTPLLLGRAIPRAAVPPPTDRWRRPCRTLVPPPPRPLSWVVGRAARSAPAGVRPGRGARPDRSRGPEAPA